MTNYCLALPYLSGGLELARKFATEECGHSKEHDEFYILMDKPVKVLLDTSVYDY